MPHAESFRYPSGGRTTTVYPHGSSVWNANCDARFNRASRPPEPISPFAKAYFALRYPRLDVTISAGGSGVEPDLSTTPFQAFPTGGVTVGSECTDEKSTI